MSRDHRSERWSATDEAESPAAGRPAAEPPSAVATPRSAESPGRIERFLEHPSRPEATRPIDPRTRRFDAAADPTANLPRTDAVRARAAAGSATSPPRSTGDPYRSSAGSTGEIEGLFPSEELFRLHEEPTRSPESRPRSAGSAPRDAAAAATTYDRTFGALIADPEAGGDETAGMRSTDSGRHRPAPEQGRGASRGSAGARPGTGSRSLFPAEPVLPTEPLPDAESLFASVSRTAAATEPEPTVRAPRPPLDPRIGSARPRTEHRARSAAPAQPAPDPAPEQDFVPEPELRTSEPRMRQDPRHRPDSRGADFEPAARPGVRSRPGHRTGDRPADPAGQSRPTTAGRKGEKERGKRDGSLQVDAELLPTLDVEPIKINGLSKQFDDNWAVRDLSFTVAPGRVTGLLGPTGAGKTTTLRMLVGLTRPTSGTATFGDHGYAALRHPQRLVGTVLGRNFHPRHSGRDHLRVAAATAGVSDEQVDDLLYLVGLSDAANRPADSYSLGMQQRLAIAGALLGEPEYLILDEPAIGLDPEGIRWLRGFLRSFAATGRAVLISSHLLNDAQQIVDDVVVIRDGRLITQINMADLAGSEGTTRLRVDDVSAARAALADLAETIVCGDEEGRYLRVRSQDVGEIGFRLHRSDVVVYELVREELNLEQLFFSALEGAA